MASASEHRRNCPIQGNCGCEREIAERDADTKQSEVEITKTSIADAAVKTDYAFNWPNLQQTPNPAAKRGRS